MHRSAPLHGNADDACARRSRLDSCGDTGNQAAAGQLHQNCVDVCQILKDLQPESALPCDDISMIKGRNGRHAFFYHHAINGLLRFIL